MRTDFDNIPDDTRITLHPRENNPLHKKPVEAIYARGCFYCTGSDPLDGPDYYLGDVATHNRGWEAL